MVRKVISNPDRLVQIKELKKAFKQFDDNVVVLVYNEINNLPFISQHVEAPILKVT